MLLGGHASGQVADHFDGSVSQANKPLFRFQLANPTGNPLTVDQVVVPLSAISGIVGADLASLRLNDGTSDIGGTGTPAIAGATGTITFAGDFTLAAGETKDITLFGDATNLVGTDTVTLSLATGNITMVTGSVGGTTPTTATHTAEYTITVASHASGQVLDQFDGSSAQNDRTLFRFRLTNNSAATATVDQIVFPLSSVVGIGTGDLDDLRLNDGTVDVSTGGVPAIAGSTGTITFAADFTVAAGASVDYALVGDASGLASGDSLTIALGTANVTLIVGSVGGGAPANATHTAEHTVLLGTHGSGQAADQFDGSLSQTDKGLFRFRLTNNSGTTATVGQVVLQLSAVAGIVDGDLTDLRLNDGTADVSLGGTPSIAAGTGTITFAADFNLAAGATKDLVLFADVASLVAGDGLTLALGTTDVTVLSGSVGGTPPAGATHTAEHTVLLASHALGQITDQWDTQATQTGTTLFRFRLTNNSGSTVTVDQVQLQLAPVVGIVSGDLSSLKITDGVVDVSTGGTPSIAGATGSITFAADFTLASGQTKDYLVIGSATSLEPLDAITVALGTTNVALAAGSVGGTAPAGIMHRTDPPSVDSEITSTDDDAWEDQGDVPDTIFRTDTELDVLTHTSVTGRRSAGFRFQNLQVLKDATVNRAVLQVYVPDTLTDTLIGTVYGHASSASPDFAALPDVDGTDNPSTRTATVASTAVNQPNYGAGWKRIDVTSIVQELVSRADWAPGGPMTFLLRGGSVSTSPSLGRLEDYSAAGTNHARLAIDFNNAALLGTHEYGQVADQFEATTGVFDRPLYQLRLKNVRAGTITLSQVIFPLSGVSGIASGDFLNLTLKYNTTQVATCTASVAGATGTITCSPGLVLGLGAIRDYTLFGDVVNLAPGDTVTIGLATTDVVVAEGPVGRLLPMPSSVTHAHGSRTPMVGYSDYAASGVRPLKFSEFSGNVWTLASNAANGPFDSGGGSTGPWPLHWKVGLTQPGLGRQVMLFQEDDSDKASLWGSVWNGANWDDGSGSPYTDAHEVLGYGTDPGMLWNDFKHWDAAYEQLSGELVMVSGINTDENILWWTYDGAAWTNYVLEQFSDNNQDAGNLFDWVHLGPMPRSNRIAFLGIGNDWPDANSAAVHAAIWDGDNNTWGSNIILSWPTTNTQNYHSTDAADIKFTLGGQNHGEAVAVWANKQYVYSSSWSPTGGWGGTKTVANLGTNKTVRWVRLEANPKSDDMVVAFSYQDGSNPNGILTTVPYEGTARTWGAPVQHTTDLYGDIMANRPFDLTWDVQSCATCVTLVYSTANPVGGYSLHYANSISSGVGFNSANGLATYQAHWVQVERDPWPDNRVRIAIQTDELRSFSGSGNIWLEDTSSAISTTTEYGANHNIQPFALAESPLWGEPSFSTTVVKLASFGASGLRPRRSRSSGRRRRSWTTSASTFTGGFRWTARGSG